MNPFEHVKNLHTKKRRWEDFNDEEKKLTIVNMVQSCTGLNQVLSQKEVFNLYFNLLPTNFRFYKWIKGEKSKKDKEKAEYLAMHFNISTREAYDYLNILDKKTIKSIIKNYKNESSKKAI